MVEDAVLQESESQRAHEGETREESLELTNRVRHGAPGSNERLNGGKARWNLFSTVPEAQE